jgi:hypothetical protein
MRERDEKISILFAAQIRNAKEFCSRSTGDQKRQETLLQLQETQRKWQEKMRRRSASDKE